MYQLDILKIVVSAREEATIVAEGDYISFKKTKIQS
jgi:hypothetical protein